MNVVTKSRYEQRVTALRLLISPDYMYRRTLQTLLWAFQVRVDSLGRTLRSWLPFPDLTTLFGAWLSVFPLNPTAALGRMETCLFPPHSDHIIF